MSKSKPPLFFGSLNEKTSESLSLYFEQEHWMRLFELVKEYETFQIIKQNADSFLIRIGKYEFNVVKDFHRCIITMGQISTLAKGACELLCKIADMLFHDRKNRFVIDTEILAYEEMMWEICFEQGIPIIPKNKTQADRFFRYAQRRNIQVKMTPLGFSNKTTKENPLPPENGGSAKA